MKFSYMVHAVFAFTISTFAAPLDPEDANGVELFRRQDEQIDLKAPIIAIPSQHWEGVDGKWSTFAIRVGTPPRVVRVMPVTSWPETWVVYQDMACDNYTGTAEECADSRGDFFKSQRSSTWESRGNFDLGLNNHLGYEGWGEYASENVGLGYDNNSAPQIEGSIVAQIVTNDWWFGILGLSFEPVNYTDFGNPIPSYMALLRDRGDISSPSWSYTAGAFYRLKSVFGQLIFGGYDKSRFEENDVIFTMSGDNLRDILVTIRSISSTTEGGEATELMGEAEADFFYIDSSIPDLWLPVSVCEKFEEAFGIAWNESSNRYILSEDQHQSLKDLNPEITVTLANQKEGGTTTTITFPYLAFDHELSYPAYERPDNASTAESGGSLADSAPSDSVAYFPIRRAEDSSQYTLGRVFLQEAYITVDYNSRTFNVSQAVFLDPPSPNVLPVPPNLSQPANDTNDPTKTGPDGTESGTDGNGDSKSGGTKISGGIIAVIIVCAILGALLVVALIFLLCPCAFLPGFVLCGIAFGAARHQKKYEGHDDVKPVEIDGTRIGETAYGEQASAMKHELPDNVARAEIQGNPIMHPQELPAELPSALLKEHEATMRERSSTENPISSDETKVGAGHVSESSEGHSTDPVSSLSSGQRREHEERRLGRVAESDIVSPVSPNTEIWRRAHGQSGEDSPVVGWSSQSPRKGGMTSEGERE